ncbi:MAG: cation transporter [Alphaproteobacteria bacterium]|nr:cation transporter [Alphaproteobacteria bacterium]MCB9791949.1 cation transporter [Alphaproteobacteria bacterium]
MSHAHTHGHHEHGDAGRNLGLAFALNVSFTLIELVGAWYTSSTAIAADALHDLGDSLSLAFAWGMQGLSKSRPTQTYSYGFKRLSLVGALVNAVVLLAGGLVVLTESIPRLQDPGQPDAKGMLALAVLGVLVNGAAVLRVRHGSSLNERVVTWHLLEDVLGWVAVLIVSVVMLFADLPVLDPLLSVLITAWIAFNAARNLKKTVDVFLQAVPEDVDVERLHEEVLAVEGVLALRHVHVWSLEGEHHVLTGHLVVDCEDLDAASALREQVRRRLQDLGIDHVTLESVSTRADQALTASCS